MSDATDDPAQIHKPFGLDKGADRDTRVHPCARTAWCLEPLDHEGPCIEKDREPSTKRQAWDAKTPDPPGWGMIACTLCQTVHAGYNAACPARKK